MNRKNQRMILNNNINDDDRMNINNNRNEISIVLRQSSLQDFQNKKSIINIGYLDKIKQ